MTTAHLIIPYTNSMQAGSIAHAITRSDEVDAVLHRLQQQGYLAGPAVPLEPCWPPDRQTLAITGPRSDAPHRASATCPLISAPLHPRNKHTQAPVHGDRGRQSRRGLFPYGPPLLSRPLFEPSEVVSAWPAVARCSNQLSYSANNRDERPSRLRPHRSLPTTSRH